MLLRKMAAPVALSLAVMLWQLTEASDVLASPSPEIAQTDDSTAAPAAEPEETPEEAAENKMLEKADVAAAIGFGEAHLRAAKELAASGKAADAETHLTRVRAFLGPEMTESLTEAGVPSLAEPVAATATGGAAAVDAAIVAFAAAREGVSGGVPDQTRYALKVAVALLFYALDEYRIWINDPGAETTVDYQGARGMVRLAAAMADRVKPAVAARSQESANGVASAMTAILSAFPDAAPPAKPVLLEGDMTALVVSVNEFSEGF